MDKAAIERHFSGKYTEFYDRFLPNLKKAGKDERTAICPFHDDRDPSLTVNTQSGLFHCFGCDEGGDIFDFFAKQHNLNTRADFPKILNEIAKEFGIMNADSPKKSTVAARYDYCDADGKLIYQIERLEPKSFRIRRPDGNGGWIYKKEDAHIVPYHLQGILKATEIIVVEGEKDADTLLAMGLTATTNPFGAGKWPDHFGQHFNNKDVVLVPDNDEPGRAHMKQVAANLEGHAASIRWLDLQDLPEKGDVSDFIATFKNQEEAAERLAIMIEGATLYEPSEANNILQDPVASVPCISDVSTSEHDLLIFPDIMSGAAGNFATIYGSHLEPARHFFYMAYLTCLGNLISGIVSLASEVLSPGRLFTLLLGESADDRKSTAISKTVKFFREAITDFSVCHGVGSAEGLVKTLTEHPRLLLVYDEFKAFVSKSKIESSVLLPCVTTLFESDWYENVTVKRTLSIDGADLSMLAACTLDTYETIFDQSFLAIGFPNRLFLCPGKSSRKYAFPARISDQDKLSLKKDLREVLLHATKHPEICITDPARDIYQDWYLAIPGSLHSKRIDTYSLRLMQLLVVNENKSVVDEDIIAKVIALSNWQLAVRRRHDPVDADSVMARMEEKIRRVLASGSKKKRDLQRAVHSDRVGIWYFDTAINNLQKSEEIKYDEKSKRYSAC